MTQIAQTGQTGGNAVADKRVSFSYAGNGQLLAIQRYQADQLVASSQYTYGALGQLAALVHAQGSTTLASYSFTYAGEQEGQATAYSLVSAEDICWLPSPGVDTSGIVQALIEQAQEGRVSLTGVTSNDGTVTYTYDPTGQLTAATYSSSNSQSPIPNPSESYVYDLTGNRVSVASGSSSSTYVIGAGNRLISDGTYTYSYDAEGNRTTRWTDVDADGVLDAGDTDVTEYTWDNRNRLVKVTDYATFGGDAVQIVGYSYDVQNRWIGEQLDSNGDGVVDHQTNFVYDGHQIALQCDKDGPGDVTGANLSHRYLWGAAVDQLLCDEQVADAQTPGNVVWPLTDHLGTVRDLAILDTQTGETSVANHRVYDSFGKLVSQTNAAVDCLFGFTGRPLDQNTGLQNNVNRWYDAKAGRWVSEDPIQIRGGDGNTYCYVGNSPPNVLDSTGLQKPAPGTSYRTAPRYGLPWRDFPGAEKSSGLDAIAQKLGHQPRAGSPTLVYMGWPEARQKKFYETIKSAWGTDLEVSAQRNCIPVNLLWNVICAELIDFRWNDYYDFGDSLGPGQLTQGMMIYYGLNRGKFSTPQEALVDIRQNIEMTAERIDRQIEELRLGVAGGGSATDPAYAGIPALQNVPKMNTEFTPQFSAGDLNLRWNTNTAEWDRAARSANPSAVYNAIVSQEGSSGDETTVRRRAGCLAAILQWMNDICPGATGNGEPRLFEGEHDRLARTPASNIDVLIGRGTWPY